MKNRSDAVGIVETQVEEDGEDASEGNRKNIRGKTGLGRGNFRLEPHQALKVTSG